MGTKKNTTDALEEELLLHDKVGRNTPFLTPEGYFQALPGRVMQRIAARRRRLTVWRWSAAAVVACLVCSASLLFYDKQETLTADNASTEYIEDALDYSMIDNMDIATYLTEAE